MAAALEAPIGWLVRSSATIGALKCKGKWSVVRRVARLAGLVLGQSTKLAGEDQTLQGGQDQDLTRTWVIGSYIGSRSRIRIHGQQENTRSLDPTKITAHQESSARKCFLFIFPLTSVSVDYQEI